MDGAFLSNNNTYRLITRTATIYDTSQSVPCTSVKTYVNAEAQSQTSDGSLPTVAEISTRRRRLARRSRPTAQSNNNTVTYPLITRTATSVIRASIHPRAGVMAYYAPPENMLCESIEIEFTEWQLSSTQKIYLIRLLWL